MLLRRPVVDIERYLCFKEPDDEWCGILFYTIDGELDDPDNCTFDVKYLYPMHIGTSGGTTIENHEDILDLFDEKPELEDDDIRQGFIHSHNKMGTFFSGTDKKQLEDGADDFDLFLSVITNNAQDYIARISFNYTSKVEKEVATRWFASEEQSEQTDVGYWETKIVYHVCSEGSEFIQNRYEQIKAEKKASSQSTVGYQYGYNKTHTSTHSKNGSAGTNQQDMFEEAKEFQRKTGILGKLQKEFDREDHPELFHHSTRDYMAGGWLIKELGIHLLPSFSHVDRYCRTKNALTSSSVKLFNDIVHHHGKNLWAVSARNKIESYMIDALDATAYNPEELLSALMIIDFHWRHGITLAKGEDQIREQLCAVLSDLYDEYSVRYAVQAGVFNYEDQQEE